ncbi:alpha/beta hydrolase [Enterococcus sp.]|uniref:alpha/beta hydrolase n=1 Tax=Enterococcus sp. TaxID=35783 RepID=UPI003C793718
MWKWFVLIIMVLVITSGIGWFYLKRWVKFFVDGAVQRRNQWFATEGAALINPGWERRTSEHQASHADFWLQEHTWRIETPDRLTLVAAAFVQKTASPSWVIALHGYRSTGFQDMADVAQHYYEEGYNVLVPDLRGHGRSQGEIIGMGWLDRLDLVQWIEQICQREPQAQIILHGCSIGGAAALMASGEKLPDNVKLIISDSAYTSVYSEFKWLLRKYTKYPVNRFMVLANRYARRKIGYSLIQASVTRQLGSNHLPILLLHGKEDRFIAAKEMETLLRATAGPKECRLFEGCGHLEAKEKAASLYWQTVTAFIEKYGLD